MSTPTNIVYAPPDAGDVFSRLEEERQRQQEATPEPIFRAQDAEQSYKWLCELEHRKLTCKDIDKHRTQIGNKEYWECEAQHWRTVLFDTIWKDLCRQHLPGGSEVEGWRNVSLAVVRRLKRYGFDSKEIQQSRQSIDNEHYWEPEAECLRALSALQEQEMLEQHWSQQAALPDQCQPSRAVPKIEKSVE